MKKLKINLYSNFKIENRISMDVVSNIMLDNLKKNKNLIIKKIIPNNFFNIKSINKNLININLMRFERYINYPLQIRKLDECDIAHVIDHQYAHIIKTIRCKLKFITVHDLVPFVFSKKNKKFPHLLDYSLKHLKFYDYVFAVSKNTRNDIIKYTDCPKEKIIVIHNCVEEFFNTKNIDKKKFCEKFGIPVNNKKILIHLSRGKDLKNYFIKNPNIVFKTLREILKIRKDITFINLGGKLDLSNNQDLKKNIISINFQTRKSISKFYKIADILFYPSIYEGFGLPILEAMKSGLPIVASNNSSIPEILDNAGIMHNSSDYLNFTKSILKLLKNKNIVHKLKKNCLIQSKKFEREKITKLMTQCYFQKNEKN